MLSLLPWLAVLMLARQPCKPLGRKAYMSHAGFKTTLGFGLRRAWCKLEANSTVVLLLCADAGQELSIRLSFRRSDGSTGRIESCAAGVPSGKLQGRAGVHSLFWYGVLVCPLFAVLGQWLLNWKPADFDIHCRAVCIAVRRFYFVLLLAPEPSWMAMPFQQIYFMLLLGIVVARGLCHYV